MLESFELLVVGLGIYASVFVLVLKSVEGKCYLLFTKGDRHELYKPNAVR